MSKRKLIVLFLSFVTLLTVLLQVKVISAQSAELNLGGLGEVPTDSNYNLNLNINSPTNIAYLSIVLTYDSTILKFDSVDSQYLVYDAEKSTEESLSLRANQVNIPQGDTDLGIIVFSPRKAGNLRFRIQSASAFTADELIVGVNIAQTMVLVLVEAENYIPLPSITPSISSTSQSSPATSMQDSSVQTTETIEETTSMEEVETSTTVEISVSTEESSTTEIAESVLESSKEIESSTTIIETSTISSEASHSIIESEVSSSSDAGEKSDSGFKFEIPIIFLLLLAAGITIVIISRKK